MALIIGSTACDLGREPKDIDLIMTVEEFERVMASENSWSEARPTSPSTYMFRRGEVIFDVEIAFPGSTGEELIDYVTREHHDQLEFRRWWIPMHGVSTAVVASPDVVLALKLSHRYKASPHFKKTMQDIKFLRSSLSASVPETLQDWLNRREKETLAYHKHPNLNQKSSGFFTDNVPYVYVHDTIHLAMARPGLRPAYMEFQKDGAEVRVDRDKWLLMTDARRLDSVLEEAYVLALERHQIPNNFRPDRSASFLRALEKICTTISSGWWRGYAWEHYDDAVDAYDSAYVDRFKDALASGIVKHV